MSTKQDSRPDTEPDSFYDGATDRINASKEKQEQLNKDYEEQLGDGADGVEDWLKNEAGGNSGGYFQQPQAPQKKKGGIKGWGKKKVAAWAGGLAITALGPLILGFINLLPFELQHLKSVFENGIGANRDTVLGTRRGLLTSRIFFFNDPEGNFNGYAKTGMVAQLTGANRRNQNLINELEADGFRVNFEEINGVRTGKVNSIQIDDRTLLTDQEGFLNNYRGRANARAEISDFFERKYPEKSSFWRSVQARKVYQRYSLTRVRGNWLQEAGVRKVEGWRLKMRQAMYGDPPKTLNVTASTLNEGETSVNADGEIEVDSDGDAVASSVDSSGELTEAATERRADILDGADGRTVTPDLDISPAELLAKAPGSTRKIATGAINIIGPADTACQGQRLITAVSVGARTLRKTGLITASALVLSAADILVSGGKIDANDIGNVVGALRKDSPETGRNGWGSGSWQWVTGNKDAVVNSNIRDKYSVAGGLTGTIGSLSNRIAPFARGCGTITNPFVQAGGFVAGLAATGFTFGGYTAVKAGAQVIVEGLKVVAEIILLPMIIDMVAGTIAHGDEYGDEFMAIMVSGYVAYNGLQASNHGMRPLTVRQNAILTQESELRLAREQSRLSIAERYFSPSNYRSLTASVLISAPNSISSLSQTMSSFVSNPFGFLSSPANLLSGNRAYASAQPSSQCQDPDTLSYNLATDPFCNTLFGEDISTLSILPEENLQYMLDNNYIDENGDPLKTLPSGRPNTTDSDGDGILNWQEYENYLEFCAGELDVLHDNKNSEFESRRIDICFIGSDKTDGPGGDDIPSGLQVAELGKPLAYISKEEAIARSESDLDFNDLDIAWGLADPEEVRGAVYAQEDGQDSAQSPTLLQRFRVNLLDQSMLAAGDEEYNGTFAVNTNSTAGTIANGAGLIVGDPYSSSVSVQCDPNTSDLGIHDTYVRGVITPARLCAITNIPSEGRESTVGSTYYVEGAAGSVIVNSRMSGAWNSLAEAALADGVNLRAISSYRTNENQERLWRELGMDSSRVARPGNSPHQAAVAIDFIMPKVNGNYIKGASCTNRASNPDASYVWLNENANNFGIKQYAAEAWHWDASPAANRC